MSTLRVRVGELFAGYLSQRYGFVRILFKGGGNLEGLLILTGFRTLAGYGRQHADSGRSISDGGGNLEGLVILPHLGILEGYFSQHADSRGIIQSCGYLKGLG